MDWASIIMSQKDSIVVAFPGSLIPMPTMAMASEGRASGAPNAEVGEDDCVNGEEPSSEDEDVLQSIIGGR